MKRTATSGGVSGSSSGLRIGRGSYWSLSHDELLRQLNHERDRIKDLELIRNKQMEAITELESEIRDLKIHGLVEGL